MLALAAAALLLANPTPMGSKQANPKPGLPGVTPMAKSAAGGIVPGVPSLVTLRNKVLDVACPNAPTSVPCKNRDYIRLLMKEKDAAKKTQMMEAHRKELATKTPAQRLKDMDTAWAEFKSFYTSYCANPKDPAVCSNPVMKSTYTAASRPRTTPLTPGVSKTPKAAPKPAA